MSIWPTPGFAHQLSYGLFTISANFLLPVITFIYCYGRIGVIIWRRREPTTDLSGYSFSVANMSGACVAGEFSVADAIMDTTVTSRVNIQRAHARQTNVIKTLVVVSLIFFICWLPIETLYALLNAGYPIDMGSDLWYACSVLSYANLFLNPLLYAWQYETVRTSVRILVNRALGVSTDNDLSIDVKSRKYRTS